MSGPMSRAILEGRKSQTRRIVDTDKFMPPGWKGMRDVAVGFGMKDATPDTCPYGKPGDRLWVKETFFVDHIDHVRGQLPKSNK